VPIAPNGFVTGTSHLILTGDSRILRDGYDDPYLMGPVNIEKQ